MGRNRWSSAMVALPVSPKGPQPTARRWISSVPPPSRQPVARATGSDARGSGPSTAPSTDTDANGRQAARTEAPARAGRQGDVLGAAAEADAGSPRGGGLGFEMRPHQGNGNAPRRSPADGSPARDWWHRCRRARPRNKGELHMQRSARKGMSGNAPRRTAGRHRGKWSAAGDATATRPPPRVPRLSRRRREHPPALPTARGPGR